MSKAVLVIRVPLDDDGTGGVADLAQGAFSVGSPETWQRVAENGGSLDELVAEVLIEGGVAVGEEAFAFSVEAV